MKQLNFKDAIEMPQGVELNVVGSTVTVKGEKGEVTKEFKMPRLTFSKEGNSLVTTCPKYGIYDKRNYYTVHSEGASNAQI